MNAILARALTDGTFLEALAQDSEKVLQVMGLPEAARIEAQSLDCGRLEQLASFVCKVQNNDLWGTLPLTLTMLHASGHELEVFGAYRPSRPPRGASLRQRTEAFVQFVAPYLAARPSQVPGLDDLLRHEWLVVQLSKAWYDPAPVEGLEDEDRSHETDMWRPQLRGVVVVRRYEHDPLRATTGGDLDPPSRLTATETFVCYAKTTVSEGRPRMFRVDPAVALVLGAIDGQRTPGDLATFVGPGIDAATVVAVLISLSEKGLVTPASTAAQRGLPASGTHPGKDPILGILTGHALSRSLYSLQRIGVLDHLAKPCEPEALAADLGVERVWLDQVLEFIATDATIIRRLDDGRYVSVLDSLAQQRLAFELTKFVGAYGPCLDAVGPAPQAVDEEALASGFALSSEHRRRRQAQPTVLVDVLRHFKVFSGLLDLGCGTGDLLVELATSERSFVGMGIDANGSMCAVARCRLEEAGVAARVAIHHGDALGVLRRLPSGTTAGIRALHAGSFFNALFGTGTVHEAVRALTELRASFGGFLLLVNDYYGGLGSDRYPQGGPSWSLLQDVAQVCSGQGVPPGHLMAWEELYQRAGCQLLRAYESDLDSHGRFLHAVRLGMRD